MKSDKMVAFLYDNCKNIEIAGNIVEEEHGWLSLGCAGHTLQLCVNSGLEIPVISRAIAVGRRLTTHFGRRASSTCFKNMSTGHENGTT